MEVNKGGIGGHVDSRDVSDLSTDSLSQCSSGYVCRPQDVEYVFGGREWLVLGVKITACFQRDSSKQG